MTNFDAVVGYFTEIEVALADDFRILIEYGFRWRSQPLPSINTRWFHAHAGLTVFEAECAGLSRPDSDPSFGRLLSMQRQQHLKVAFETRDTLA